MKRMVRNVFLASIMATTPNLMWAGDLNADNLMQDPIVSKALHQAIEPLFEKGQEFMKSVVAMEASDAGEKPLFTDDEAFCVNKVLTSVKPAEMIPEVIAGLRQQPLDVRQRWVPFGEFLKTKDGARFLTLKTEGMSLMLDAVVKMVTAIREQEAKGEKPEGAEAFGMMAPLFAVMKKQEEFKREADGILERQSNADALRVAMADFDMQKDTTPFAKVLEAVITPKMDAIKADPRCKEMDNLKGKMPFKGQKDEEE